MVNHKENNQHDKALQLPAKGIYIYVTDDEVPIFSNNQLKLEKEQVNGIAIDLIKGKRVGTSSKTDQRYSQLWFIEELPINSAGTFEYKLISKGIQIYSISTNFSVSKVDITHLPGDCFEYIFDFINHGRWRKNFLFKFIDPQLINRKSTCEVWILDPSGKIIPVTELLGTSIVDGVFNYKCKFDDKLNTNAQFKLKIKI